MRDLPSAYCHLPDLLPSPQLQCRCHTAGKTPLNFLHTVFRLLPDEQWGRGRTTSPFISQVMALKNGKEHQHSKVQVGHPPEPAVRCCPAPAPPALHLLPASETPARAPKDIDRKGQYSKCYIFLRCWAFHNGFILIWGPQQTFKLSKPPKFIHTNHALKEHG